MKTDSWEITEQEWIVVKTMLANVKASLAPVTVPGAATDKKRKGMEEYVAQSEKQ